MSVVEETKGEPSLKPWAFATKSPYIIKLIPKLCPGGHTHVACRGKDAKESEGYTDALAAAIHQAWALQVLDDHEHVKRKPQCKVPSLRSGALLLA